MRNGLLGRFFGVLGTFSAKELWERSTEHIYKAAEAKRPVQGPMITCDSQAVRF